MTALLLALWQAVKPHALVVGCCCAIGLGGFALGYHVGHPSDPLPVQQAHTQTSAAHDTVRKVDTLVKLTDRLLTKALTTYIRDTVHDTVPLTVRIHDTLWVKSEVRACDSLAVACGAFQTAARAKFAADSLLFSAQAQELAAWKDSRPSKLRRLTTNVVMAAAGFGLCKSGLSIPFLSH